jgi:hypothetical protein
VANVRKVLGGSQSEARDFLHSYAELGGIFFLVSGRKFGPSAPLTATSLQTRNLLKALYQISRRVLTDLMYPSWPLTRKKHPDVRE